MRHSAKWCFVESSLSLYRRLAKFSSLKTKAISSLTSPPTVSIFSTYLRVSLSLFSILLSYLPDPLTFLVYMQGWTFPTSRPWAIHRLDIKILLDYMSQVTLKGGLLRLNFLSSHDSTFMWWSLPALAGGRISGSCSNYIWSRTYSTQTFKYVSGTYMDTHIYTHTYIHTVNLKPYIYIYIYIYTCTYIHVLIPTHVSTHMHKHVAKFVHHHTRVNHVTVTLLSWKLKNSNSHAIL